MLTLLDRKEELSELQRAWARAKSGHAQLAVLWGRRRVGKTCLIKSLRGEPFDEKEPETPGIERHRLPLRKGQHVVISAEANTLDLPLDPMLRLADPDGTIVGTAVETGATRDAAPSDG